MVITYLLTNLMNQSGVTYHLTQYQSDVTYRLTQMPKFVMLFVTTNIILTVTPNLKTVVFLHSYALLYWHVHPNIRLDRPLPGLLTVNVFEAVNGMRVHDSLFVGD